MSLFTELYNKSEEWLKVFKQPLVAAKVKNLVVSYRDALLSESQKDIES